MIPQNNPLANYLSHQAAIDLAIHQVSKSGSYILGEETAAFEREFAEYAGVKYAVGVGNGTEALHLALRALGVGPGDEVITASHTSVATVAAIEMTGAEPVFADIDPNSFTIAPKEVEKAITGRTKVILPVHLYGHPADLRPLLECAKQHDLYLLEDCAQAHGAVYHGRKVGSWGDAGAFSFYPTKNLGCLGDGGAVTTSSPELHERLLALRQYGWDRKRISLEPGFNSRLDELQAAILRVKLKYLNENNQKRMRVARAYDQTLGSSNLVPPWTAPGSTHVYHQYVVRCRDNSARDRLMHFLSEQGIQTAVHYPVPVHLQPAYAHRLPETYSLPVTEDLCRRILSLPLYPELTDEQIARVAKTIATFFSRSL